MLSFDLIYFIPFICFLVAVFIENKWIFALSFIVLISFVLYTTSVAFSNLEVILTNYLGGK